MAELIRGRMEHKRAEVVVRRVFERARMAGWEVGSSFLSPPQPVFGDANCKLAFDGGHTSCSFIVQIREAIQERGVVYFICLAYPRPCSVFG